MPENPYSAPQTAPDLLQEPDPTFQIILASRWARLGASIIDYLILVAIIIAVAVPLVYLGIETDHSTVNDFLDSYDQHSDEIFGKLIDTAVIITFYIALNGYFMVKSGQTIGKKALGIQVVSYQTHQLLSLGKIIGMRFIVTSILSNISLFAIIDALFIFGAEKRCVHDHMAGSIVIKRNPAL